jgi:hypothetical protein
MAPFFTVVIAECGEIICHAAVAIGVEKAAEETGDFVAGAPAAPTGRTFTLDFLDTCRTGPYYDG